MTNGDLVPMMWIGNVRALSFSDQLQAATEGGFSEMSVTPMQCAQMQASGVSLEQMRHRAQNQGVRLSRLDPLTRWSRSWLPVNVPEAQRNFFAFTTEDFLRTASELEVASLTAISTGPVGSLPVSAMIDEFGTLCQTAAQVGVRCDLEFIPLDWGVPDLSTAWRILEGAGESTAGLIFDFWHFMRSDADWTTLESIPGERISEVQLADATLVVPPGRSLVENCLEDRVPPGCGEFDTARLLQTLDSIGGLRRVGPEIFSAVFDGLTAAEIGTICRGSLVDSLDAAGISHGLGAAIPDWREIFNSATREHAKRDRVVGSTARAHL